MKRKLIIGLSLVLLLFTVGAVVVVKNLNAIMANQKITNEQDIIIGKYNEMLFQMKGAQAELYRHQAGYTRNIDDLVNYIEAFDDNINYLSESFIGHLHDVACTQCHAKITDRLNSIAGFFEEINTLTRGYKGNVSILITSSDESQTKELEDAATTQGNSIILKLEKIRHAADNMRKEIRDRRSNLIERSRTIIFVSMFLTITLSALIFLLVFRGITGPITSLIAGIQTIASGDFSRRVEVKEKDEIGFMAGAFNDMAARLSAMNEEKDSLLLTLRGFNEELETKVKEATEKLRLTQESMARTETLAAVGTLSAGVSHEISTPLNSIIGFTQLLLSEMEENNPAKGDLKVIEQEAVRCKKIIQGLLTFARTRPHEEALTDLNSLLSDTLLLIEYQPSMRKITIERDLDQALKQVEADTLQIKQVFLNIILNAVQAMPEGGRLTIATRNTKDGVEITVSDTGIGISEETKQKIFQPFFTTKKDGTGLGLSISYGIIKEHEGEIVVESEAGRGTTFRILLPVSHRGLNNTGGVFREDAGK
ncbi:MAG: HAMP domain-containing protein [Nitrospirae bacterium]|nr:HAMP domain-containing protein [Nitrospirota bacterium]